MAAPAVVLVAAGVFWLLRRRWPDRLAAWALIVSAAGAVAAAAAFTAAPHSVIAASDVSTVATSRASMCARQLVIHSTCCSIATGMLVSTDGLPGPVMVNRLGKPATCRPI